MIVDDPVKIYTYITTKEAEEGLTTKCDRKSLKRIFDKLSDTGKIKIIRTNIDIGTRSKEYTFICRSDITENHSMVKSAIGKKHALKKYDQLCNFTKIFLQISFLLLLK